MRVGTWMSLVCSALMLLVAGGCRGGARPATADYPTPAVAFTPIPTLTAVLSPSPDPLNIATEMASTPTAVFAQVSADNVNLRTEPGTVFPVRLMLSKGTHVQVLGRAPGGEWLYIQTDAKITGWVLYRLVNDGHDGGPTPLMEPQNVQLIKGRIVDLAGVPVSGIGFAFEQETGAKVARTDATSDATGQFYAYLPLSASGRWVVSQVSVACTSNTMDAKCNCIGRCGQADPQSMDVELPSDGLLHFVWK